MSEIIDPNGDVAATVRSVVVHRVVDFEVGTGGDGRSLYTRIVPWDTPATVSDPPTYVPYPESWARGSFDKQLKAANRVDVLMNFEHEKGIGGVVGRGVELRSEDDGLHGTFRMLATQDADKALELVREEVLTGLSLEARVIRSERVDGVVVRKDARLVNVALCRTPAFKDARVLAVREAGDEDDGDEEPTPPAEPEPELEPVAAPEARERIEIPSLDTDRLEALGIETRLRIPELDVERLAALGIDTKLRTFVDAPWDGSPSRWEDASAYCRASLVDNNPSGAEKTAAQCHFPYKEPNGDINVNALRAIVGGRGAQAKFPGAAAARARARKLLDEFRNQ